MDKTKLKRHDLVFLSAIGKDKIWHQVADKYQGGASGLVRDILQGADDVPGIIRRDDDAKVNGHVAVGFVHHQRLDGSRLRVGAFTNLEDIVTVMTPYEVMQRKAYAHDARTKCMQTALNLYNLALSMDLQVGVLGSAGLELATGLPYTDEASDIDFLIKPVAYEKLKKFYLAAQTENSSINMDFEVDFPNGYGVKLAEVLMKTQTVLGKSINDVNLLNRKDIMQYL